MGAQYLFGSGSLWGTPLTDAGGNTITTPTPVQFGALQDVTLDFTFEQKFLYGQYQFPIDMRRGKGKIDMKAKLARINGSTMNSLLFGQTLTTGSLIDYKDVTGEVIPATPYQITVTNSATFTADLGVRDVNGTVLTKVASAPATGQYSVAAGVYTFAAADVGKTMYIDYQYTLAASGLQGTMINELLGATPTFQVDFGLNYGGQAFTLSFPYCIATKLTMATKLDDYTIPEMDISAFANNSGTVFKLSVANN